jgi:hypothetical protein
MVKSKKSLSPKKKKGLQSAAGIVAYNPKTEIMPFSVAR